MTMRSSLFSLALRLVADHLVEGAGGEAIWLGAGSFRFNLCKNFFCVAPVFARFFKTPMLTGVVIKVCCSWPPASCRSYGGYNWVNFLFHAAPPLLTPLARSNLLLVPFQPRKPIVLEHHVHAPEKEILQAHVLIEAQRLEALPVFPLHPHRQADFFISAFAEPPPPGFDCLWSVFRLRLGAEIGQCVF